MSIKKRVMANDGLEITIVAKGPPASGKTYILTKMVQLLSKEEFHIDDLSEFRGGYSFTVPQGEILRAHKFSEAFQIRPEEVIE